MSRLISFFPLILVLASGYAQEKVPALELADCRWFDGSKFVTGTLYSVRGKFTFHRPARIDSVLHLAGRYVIPPFAEAHNHNIDGFAKVDDRIRRYLADGVFYVKNPNSIPRYTATLAGKINTPASVDVIFSNGGLTASGGHPMELVRRNTALGIFTDRDGEGGMYYVVDNPDELRRKWNIILDGRPDFIKTYLLYSEEFAERRDDTAYFGWKGLDPALLPEIVRAAHRAKLRVSTHVETAADFHNALIARTDEINHLPGFRADSLTDFRRYELSEEDARSAAVRRVVIVTTLAGSEGSGSERYRERLKVLQKRNLLLLRRYGAVIAIGSDEYRQTSAAEAAYLSGLGIFSPAELLGMWCRTTAEAIFPGRKIGRIREGYEASFLVLEGDPLADFSFTHTIILRCKEGRLMKGPEQMK
ncbi:MAG TPA: amidohydrolase [Bacteroidota bacterium]|nr:amidohydrolase [Bacteroidota bacterium]